jgi:enoyl-CoA hydratase/carnithine racemase
MNDDLLISTSDGIGWLTLNRPQTRNALDPAYLHRLIAAVQAFDTDPAVRVLVLRANGKTFCSGGSLPFLKELTRMDREQIQHSVYTGFQGITRALRLCSKPVIASVQGAAVGAGCEIAIACDFRVVAEDAYFCENWVELGLMPPLGGLYLLPRLVGAGIAADMVMRAIKVNGTRAAQIGLASEAVPVDQLEAATTAFAQALARRAPPALQAMKLALRRGLENTQEAEWALHIQAQLGLIQGPDFARFAAGLG